MGRRVGSASLSAIPVDTPNHHIAVNQTIQDVGRIEGELNAISTTVVGLQSTAVQSNWNATTGNAAILNQPTWIPAIDPQYQKGLTILTNIGTGGLNVTGGLTFGGGGSTSNEGTNTQLVFYPPDLTLTGQAITPTMIGTVAAPTGDITSVGNIKGGTIETTGNVTVAGNLVGQTLFLGNGALNVESLNPYVLLGRPNSSSFRLQNLSGGLAIDNYTDGQSNHTPMYKIEPTSSICHRFTGPANSTMQMNGVDIATVNDLPKSKVYAQLVNTTTTNTATQGYHTDYYTYAVGTTLQFTSESGLMIQTDTANYGKFKAPRAGVYGFSFTCTVRDPTYEYFERLFARVYMIESPGTVVAVSGFDMATSTGAQGQLGSMIVREFNVSLSGIIELPAGYHLGTLIWADNTATSTTSAAETYSIYAPRFSVWNVD